MIAHKKNYSNIRPTKGDLYWQMTIVVHVETQSTVDASEIPNNHLGWC